MEKILTEWRNFLNEQTYKEVDALRKKIFAANGNIKLSNDQLGQLTKYVDYNYKSDPLGAAQIAAAIKVYYRANKEAPGAAAIVRKYAKLEKHFKGLAPQAGRSPTVRAVDAFLGAKDPVVEKGLYSSPNSPDFAKAIIYISTGFKSLTGINILDPTMPKTVPKWASKHPTKWAIAQTVADLFAETPFHALDTLLLFGSIAPGRVGKLARTPVSQAWARIKAGPAIRKVGININAISKAIAEGNADVAATQARKAIKANKEAKQIIKKLPAEEAQAAIALEAVEGMMRSRKDFVKWYVDSFEETFGSAAIATKMGNNFFSANRWIGKVEIGPASMAPLEAFVNKKHQFYKLLKRHNTVIDLKHVDNAFALNLSSSNEYQIAMLRAEKFGIPIKGPIVSPGIGIGRAKLAGGELYAVSLHEIGHIKFWQNAPVVGKSFLQEYKKLLEKVIQKKTEKLGKKFQNINVSLDDLAAMWGEPLRNQGGYHQTRVGAPFAGPGSPRRVEKVYPAQADAFPLPKAGEKSKLYRRRMRQALKKKNIHNKDVQDFIDLYIMREYLSIVDGFIDNPIMFFGEEASKKLKIIETMKGNKQLYFGSDSTKNLYYLDPHEAFAELFEKTSRMRGTAGKRGAMRGPRARRIALAQEKGIMPPPRRQRGAASENFPKTVEQINKIVKKDINPYLKENKRKIKFLITTRLENYLLI